MPHPDSPSPEEETRLRRLLAQSRETGPMPDDVAARMDATLAELGEERAADAGADVVPLARRRRRALAGVLAAAAIVVVAGVGINEVVRTGGTGDSTTATQSEADDEAGNEDAGRAAEEGAAADSATLESEPEVTSSLRESIPVEIREVDGPLPRIAQRRLERDALQVRRDLPPGAFGDDAGAVLYAPADFTCLPEAWGAGVFVGVQYRSRNAVLAFREPSEQNQVAEVLQCGTGTGLRSVTLSAP